MTTRLLLERCLWLFLLIFLAACGGEIVNPTVTSTSTALPLPAMDLTAVFTTPTLAGPTPLVNQQAIDAWRTQVSLATPIRTPVVLPAVRKFPSVSVEDGNLYLHNSAGQSLNLTNSGQDRDPVLSDAGRKIVFYRGEAHDNLYSIHSDGRHERVILSNETPLLLGKGKIVFPIFVPNTHLLLFNTSLCGPKKGLYDYADCVFGVYSLDIDTGTVNEVVGNINGNSMWGRNFEISPDGQYVSVAGVGQINIYSLSSGRFQIAYSSVLAYHITPDDEYLPRQYWLPDSSGLIFILAAAGEYNEPATPPALYDAVRYTMKDKQAVHVALDKFIVWDIQYDYWCVSPDRNWLLFAGNETGDRRDYSLHYLGNLINGHTQVYEDVKMPLFSCRWSPDSRHFVSGSTFFIGSVDGSPPISIPGYFVDWIDATHYYYLVDSAAGTTEFYIGEISGN